MRRNRGSVRHIEPRGGAEQGIGKHGQTETECERKDQRDRDRTGNTIGAELDATLEADRQHQIERQTFADCLGDGEIGSEPAGYDAQGKEQDHR